MRVFCMLGPCAYAFRFERKPKLFLQQTPSCAMRVVVVLVPTTGFADKPALLL